MCRSRSRSRTFSCSLCSSHAARGTWPVRHPRPGSHRARSACAVAPPGPPRGPRPRLSSATLTLPMLIHCACGGATQPLTMASQQEDPNGSADQPTAGGDATGAVAPDPFVDAFSGRLDLDVVERKRERPLPLPPTHLAMWQQCNVAISQYRNIAIPQSRTANAPMLPPRPHAHRGSHRPSRTRNRGRARDACAPHPPNTTTTTQSPSPSTRPRTSRRRPRRTTGSSSACSLHGARPPSTTTQPSRPCPSPSSPPPDKSANSRRVPPTHILRRQENPPPSSPKSPTSQSSSSLTTDPSVSLSLSPARPPARRPTP